MLLNSGLSEILNSLPATDRRKAVRSLIRLNRAIEKQDQFDAEVAASIDRILNSPRGTAMPLAKLIKKRIRELAHD
jgi:hypothetical protein